MAMNEYMMQSITGQLLPLKASMYFFNVSIDIPLQPLARTFIRSANNIRVLSGESGFPTPGMVKQRYLTTTSTETTEATTTAIATSTSTFSLAIRQIIYHWSQQERYQKSSSNNINNSSNKISSRTTTTEQQHITTAATLQQQKQQQQQQQQQHCYQLQQSHQYQ